MYEENPKDKPTSLSTLLKLFENNRLYTKESDAQFGTTKEINTLLDRQRENIGKLKSLRDTVLAHNDRRQFGSDMWNEHSTTIGGYRALIKTSHQVLCIMADWLDIPLPVLDMGTEDEIKHLVCLIKRGKDAWLADD